MRAVKYLLLSLALSFVCVGCQAKEDYSSLIATGRSVLQTESSVQVDLMKMVTIFNMLREEGYTNVSKDYWDNTITPLLMDLHAKLTSAAEMLEAEIPANKNVRKLKEPWKSLYNIAGYMRLVDLDKQIETYDSEYLMRLVGCSDYLQMYATLLTGRCEIIQNNMDRLARIIEDPEEYKRSVEEQGRQEKEEQRQKEGERKKASKLSSTPPEPDHSLDSYNSPFSYAVIPLGLEFQDYVKRLEIKGFKLVKKELQDDLFYGKVPVAYLNGEQDGYPVTVRIKATSKSYRIYDVSVNMVDLIDEYEAREEADRLEADFVGTHPSAVQDPVNSSRGNTGIKELTDGTGRMYKQMTMFLNGVIYRVYDDPSDKGTLKGSFILEVVQVLTSQKCIVEQRFYDAHIAEVARTEADSK